MVERLVAPRALPPPSSRSPVLKSAHDALALVRELHGFVARNRGAYLEESHDADATRDDIETEVRLSVQACQAHVDMLKSTVQARAAGKEDTPQTVAHLHGVVLIVTERLAKVASAFDQCREVRFKKVLAEADRKRRRAPPPRAFARPRGGGGRAPGGAAPDDDAGERPGPGFLRTRPNADADDGERRAGGRVGGRRRPGPTRRGVRAGDVRAFLAVRASHVHTQAGQIETLYSQAVEATRAVQTGNVELRKTIQRRSDAQRLVAALMFAATFALLFIDWISG